VRAGRQNIYGRLLIGGKRALRGFKRLASLATPWRVAASSSAIRTLCRAEVSSDIKRPLRQSAMAFPVAINHVACGGALLTQTCRSRLHTRDHTAFIVD
jgi:hypothetical protein